MQVSSSSVWMWHTWLMSRSGRNEFVQHRREAARRKMVWLSGKSALCLFPGPGRPASKNTATARGDVRKALRPFHPPRSFYTAVATQEKKTKANNRKIWSNGIPSFAAFIRHPVRNLMTRIDFFLYACITASCACVPVSWRAWVHLFICARVCVCESQMEGQRLEREEKLNEVDGSNQRTHPSY